MRNDDNMGIGAHGLINMESQGVSGGDSEITCVASSSSCRPKGSPVLKNEWQIAAQWIASRKKRAEKTILTHRGNGGRPNESVETTGPETRVIPGFKTRKTTAAMVRSMTELCQGLGEKANEIA